MEDKGESPTVFTAPPGSLFFPSECSLKLLIIFKLCVLRILPHKTHTQTYTHIFTLES